MVDKHSIRRSRRRIRGALSRGDAASAGRAIARQVRDSGLLSGATTVFAYVADDGEAPTSEILAEAARLGLEVGLPRVSGDTMTFSPYRGDDDLVAGRWNIPTPSRGDDLAVTADSIIFLPLVAWDLAGNRLGRGGGYYDRAARDWPETALRVGLAYEAQRVEQIPADAWDLRLHAVVTERRVLSWLDGMPVELCGKEEADRNGIRVDGSCHNRSGGRVGLVDRSLAQPTASGPGAGYRRSSKEGLGGSE
jgi:5-formyltetrahydrofolate cyclo-ligase